MKNSAKIDVLKNLKHTAQKLYLEYLAQSGLNNCLNCMHDDSGGDPDYHCDQHENIPRRMMVKQPITKNATH